MARPPRNTVDYFPFICDEGKKMFYIEETYGNDGFAAFVKLLRELAKTEYHFLDLNKKTTLMFLAAKCKTTIIVLENIITDLVELGKFDSYLWSECRVIWCSDFIDSIQDAYKKRNNQCITYEGLVILLQSKGILKQAKEPSIVLIKPQSKVKYSKVENSKEKEMSIFNEFRMIYPGTKKGNKTEFDNFIKKHKDWKEVLSTLKLELESQISIKNLKKAKKQFVPQWKNLQTWINNRCWEEEISIEGNTEENTENLLAQ